MDARSATGPQQPAAPPPPSILGVGGVDPRGGSALPESCGLPKTSSTSLTKSVTAVHYFKVTDYTLLDGMGVGRYVSSTSFAVGGCNWAVRFYPDGATTGCVGHVSAFLYYFSLLGPTAGVRARFTLNLLERDGRMSQQAATNPCMKHTFTPASDNWGFIKFVEKSKLQPGSPYLLNDSLMIRCVLTVVIESRTVVDEVNSVAYL